MLALTHEDIMELSKRNKEINDRLVNDLRFSLDIEPREVKIGRARSLLQLDILKEIKRKVHAHRSHFIGSKDLTVSTEALRLFLLQTFQPCPATIDCAGCPFASWQRFLTEEQREAALFHGVGCVIRAVRFPGPRIEKQRMIGRLEVVIHILEHVIKTNKWDAPPGRAEVAQSRRERKAARLAKQLPKVADLQPKPKPSPRGAAYQNITIHANNTGWYGDRGVR
jgi:hypothetical protein